MSYIALFRRTVLGRACIVLALLCATVWPDSSVLAESGLPQDPSPSSPTALGSGPDAILQPAEAQPAEIDGGQAGRLTVYLPAIRRPESPPEALLAAINRTRAAHGCTELAVDAKLTHAAEVHSQDMADHDVLTHDGSDGSHLTDRVLREGYEYAYVGEAIAYWAEGQPDAVLGLWLASQGHERILLNCTAEEGGAAYVEGYWTLVVASEL